MSILVVLSGLPAVGKSAIARRLVAREGWAASALRAGAAVLVVEALCSDRAEHWRRVEQRVCDVDGLAPPDWAEVQMREREREAWPPGAALRLDTAGRSMDACVDQIERALLALRRETSQPRGSRADDA